MNTAPKLQTIISRMKLMAGIGIPIKPECIASWADELEQLALAPPSGEGVELPEPEGSMTWTRSAGVCIQPEPGYTAEQMREYRDSSPKPSPVNGEVMQVMADMVKIVERWPVRWSAEGSRLKDQIEWVRFYNLYNQIEKEQFTTPQSAPEE